MANMVRQTWLGWLVGGVGSGVDGGGQYEFNEFNFTGNGFLDLWSQQQQQHQLHESIVNRLTYECKPVKKYADAVATIAFSHTHSALLDCLKMALNRKK